MLVYKIIECNVIWNIKFAKFTLERCQVQMNNNLTVVVLTKNEEENIVAVVQNAKKVAAEVLIVDSGSTDKTVQLAEEMVRRLFTVLGIMTLRRSAILRYSM